MPHFRDVPSGNVKIAIEMAYEQLTCLFQMVIFHSYLNLPEGHFPNLTAHFWRITPAMNALDLPHSEVHEALSKAYVRGKPETSLLKMEPTSSQIASSVVVTWSISLLGIPPVIIHLNGIFCFKPAIGIPIYMA